MSGLYFKYGTMNSSKSANLLMIKHNYEEQGYSVLLLKPSIDTRDVGVVKSRIGIQSECTLISDNSTRAEIFHLCEGYDVIMVDEAQFLSKNLVDTLYIISASKVVMCFGLLTDFKREMFEGSKRLVELADSITEIKSICKCGRRAVANARFKDDKFVLEGNQIEIGAEDKYKALCRYCYDDAKFLAIIDKEEKNV